MPVPKRPMSAKLYVKFLHTVSEMGKIHARFLIECPNQHVHIKLLHQEFQISNKYYTVKCKSIKLINYISLFFV